MMASTEQLKQIVDDYFTNNYDHVLSVSKNVQNKNLNNVKDYDSLVILCYEYIVNNLHKVESIILSGKVESVVVNWMYRQTKWNGTIFKKEFVYKKDIGLGDMTGEEDDSEFELPDDSECFDDVLEREYDFQGKYNHIMVNKSELDPIDRRLYELVFLMGYNTSGKLSNITEIPRTTCWELIRDLKKDLRKGYDD